MQEVDTLEKILNDIDKSLDSINECINQAQINIQDAIKILKGE